MSNLKIYVKVGKSKFQISDFPSESDKHIECKARLHELYGALNELVEKYRKYTGKKLPYIYSYWEDDGQDVMEISYFDPIQNILYELIHFEVQDNLPYIKDDDLNHYVSTIFYKVENAFQKLKNTIQLANEDRERNKLKELNDKNFFIKAQDHINATRRSLLKHKGIK